MQVFLNSSVLFTADVKKAGWGLTWNYATKLTFEGDASPIILSTKDFVHPLFLTYKFFQITTPLNKKKNQ